MQATTLAVDAPGRDMRLARWVHSRPAPAEGERLSSTEQVSLLEGLDRDMHEWERQDGDGCGTQPPKAKGSSARGVCSCGGQHARGKSTALNARERRQSHKATGEWLSSSTTAKRPGTTREWHAARAGGSTRTRASGRRGRKSARRSSRAPLLSPPPRGRRTCEAQLPSRARSPHPQSPAQACTPHELPRPRQHASSRQHALVSQRGSDTCTYSWFARIQSASCFLQRASCTAHLLLHTTMTASLTQTL